MSLSECSSLATSIAIYPITSKVQDCDLKSYMIKMTEAFKDNISNSLEEIQENTTR